MKLIGLAFLILSFPFLVACNALNSGETESGPDVATIGIVNIASILDPVVDGLKAGMIEFEYAEGETINYIYSGPVSRDNLENEIQSLIDQNVDVIVSLTTPATVSAKELTQENQIPIVFVPVNDPIGAGIVTDLTNPGGNITGIISGASETRRLEWLLNVAPGSTQIYYPYNPDDPSPVRTLETLTEEVAPQLGLEIIPFEVSTVELLEDAISEMPDDIDAIYLPSDARVGSALADWVALAEERRIPMSASSQAHVNEGVLCSYSYSPYESGRQAARLVDQILDGVDPGTLPVETAEPLFSVNLIAANAIGLEISEDVLLQANIIVREGD